MNDLEMFRMPGTTVNAGNIFTAWKNGHHGTKKRKMENEIIEHLIKQFAERAHG